MINKYVYMIAHCILFSHTNIQNQLRWGLATGGLSIAVCIIHHLVADKTTYSPYSTVL